MTDARPGPGAPVDTAAPAFEAEVQHLAGALAREARADDVGVYHLGWWSDRVLRWAMERDDFKTRLFRLVDVFPACRDDADVLRHVEEYFADIPVPRALELGLDLAEHVPLGEVVSAAIVRRSIGRMARQFIAGSDPGVALRRLARLWESGAAATVDLLGEKTVTDTEADRYAARVHSLATALVAAADGWPARPALDADPWGPLPRANLSVKATALSPRFGPLTGTAGLDDVLDRLRPTIELARGGRATVHVDTEHDDVKDLTFELVRRIGSEHPDLALGCVVQAYRRDSFSDLCDLVDWSRRERVLPLQIRLVKGAYWDHETTVAGAAGWPVPVYEHKHETDANYERCVRYLLDHAGAVRPAIASHNLRSLAYALTYARAAGLAPGALELQLLYGMAEPVHRALVGRGHRVRVYSPVGALVPGMAYLVRRLLENTSNDSFVRHAFAEGDALDALLAPPGPLADAPAPAGSAIPVRDATTSPPVEPFTNEPHTEFRRPAARTRFERAVTATSRALGFDAPVLVAGAPVATAREIVSVDPSDPARIVCRSGCAGVADADAAVDAAVAASTEWAARPWPARAAVLFRAAAILRSRRDELATLMMFEAGKPATEADADVAEAIDFCEYYGRAALALGRGLPIAQAPGEANRYEYRPRGVGVVIAPWNFPLAIPTGMVVAGLVTGNAVVFKPSEQTPGIGYRLVQILHQAGVPPEVLAFLPGPGEEVGAHLVTHPSVVSVTFTGSRAVGLSIIERAAVHQPGQRAVRRVVAEMGGKNPIVVDADADLDVAVPAIVQSAFGYAGQKCSAASRVIVLDPVADELIDRLVGATCVVPVGPATELGTVCGPVIDAEARDRVLGYRAHAAREGTVLVARDDVPDRGFFVGPTVVTTDDPQARVATDEIFGPFVTVMRARDFDHAVALANTTEYALTAGLFSRSPARIRFAADSLRAGNVYVNRAITGALVDRQPFGGYGLSGVGSKAGGPDYLRQFVDPRTVTENTVRQGFAGNASTAV